MSPMAIVRAGMGENFSWAAKHGSPPAHQSPYQAAPRRALAGLLCCLDAPQRGSTVCQKWDIARGERSFQVWPVQLAWVAGPGGRPPATSHQGEWRPKERRSWAEIGKKQELDRQNGMPIIRLY